MPSKFQQNVKQATPYAIEEATVISYDPRDPRSLAIRISGGRVIRNCTGATAGITSGVRVMVVINRFGSGAVVIGTIQDAQTIASTGGAVQSLNPPANLAVVVGYRFLVAQWDFYPGNSSLCYQVQHNAAADEDGNEVSALVTKGSQFVYDCAAGTLRYFRVRALQYFSANNLMYSAWSEWVYGTSRGLTIALADLPLADGKIIVGNVSNEGAAVTMSGDATLSNAGALTLKSVGPGATGPVGSSTTVPVVTIDARGRVTALSSAAISVSGSGGGELLVADGVTPPDTLTTEDETDWLYSD